MHVLIPEPGSGLMVGTGLVSGSGTKVSISRTDFALRRSFLLHAEQLAISVKVEWIPFFLPRSKTTV